MKIRLLNVKYSPNLGDGVIAECLEHAISDSGLQTDVKSCDLAGRKKFGEGINKSRLTIRHSLSILPKRLQQLILSAALIYLIRTKLKKHYKNSLQSADLVLIGGGQLISGQDLNFPRKINAAMDVVRTNNYSAIILAAGVSPYLSSKALKLFRHAFKGSVSCVHLRDRGSANAWIDHFGAESDTKLLDPGFLISELYPKSHSAQRLRPIVGIGITNPTTLAAHSTDQSAKMTEKEWLEFYKRLVFRLWQKEVDVELFTNGAYGDQVFAEKVKGHVSNLSGGNGPNCIRLADRCFSPESFAKLVSQYDAVIAHRLHANIVAYAYRIPHVGLGWDRKLAHYFAETDRSKFFIERPRAQDADQVATLVIEALGEHISPDEVAILQRQIRYQIEQILRLHIDREASNADPNQGIALGPNASTLSSDHHPQEGHIS